MNKDLSELTIKEASRLLRENKIKSSGLVKACYRKINEREKDINAFITIIDEEVALRKAEAIDRKFEKGSKLSILAGIPFTIKDVYLTKGIKTTAGSKILGNYTAQYNATVYQKLIDLGAILIGKTNCDPFGFGSSTENSAYGITKNPYNNLRVAGGSSGGSAAAVSYGAGLFSIAEDTGGSIRCPSAFCNVVGLKPTYGRVSRNGAIAYVSSFDTVGPITRTVEDNAIVMSLIAGEDAKDATSSNVKVDNYCKLLHKPNLYRIGVPDEYFTDQVDKEIKARIFEKIEKLEKLGHKVIKISLPNTEYAIAAYYVVALSEAGSNLAKFDGLRYGLQSEKKGWDKKVHDTRGRGFGQEEKRRIMIGTFSLSSGYQDKYYNKAQLVRQLICEDFNSAFKKIDLIITPVTPMLPFKIGENVVDPLKLWLVDAFTVTINPVGIPAISVPVGFSRNGLPIGMQIVGSHFKEGDIYNLANQLNLQS